MPRRRAEHLRVASPVLVLHGEHDSRRCEKTCACLRFRASQVLGTGVSLVGCKGGARRASGNVHLGWGLAVSLSIPARTWQFASKGLGFRV
jgi:hypothetical protein